MPEYNANRLYAGLDSAGEVRLFRVDGGSLFPVCPAYWRRVTQAWDVPAEQPLIVSLTVPEDARRRVPAGKPSGQERFGQIYEEDP